MEAKYDDAVPTDGIAGFNTRNSMTLRRSMESQRHRRASSSSYRRSRNSSSADREHLIHNYDEEAGAAVFGLDDLAEDSEDETKRTSFDNGRANPGHGRDSRQKAPARTLTR